MVRNFYLSISWLIHTIWYFMDPEAKLIFHTHQFSSVSSVAQSGLTLQPQVNPWTAAQQASLSITNSQSLHKLMSIKSVMPSHHLILCNPLFLLPSIFPSIREQIKHQMRQFLVSASVLPKNIQDWFPLGWTGWISLLSKGSSRVFPNTTVQKHHQCSALFIVQLSHKYMTTGKTIALTNGPFLEK